MAQQAGFQTCRVIITIYKKKHNIMTTKTQHNDANENSNNINQFIFKKYFTSQWYGCRTIQYIQLRHKNYPFCIYFVENHAWVVALELR